MSWRDLDIGAVSAYAIAVEHGYKGTEEEWARDQAAAGTNAGIAREAAENAKASENAAKDALNSIVPEKDSALAAITAKGDEQVAAVQAEGEAQVQDVRDAGAEQSEALAAQGDVEQRKVVAAGDEQVARVTQTAQGTVDAVKDAEAESIAAVQESASAAGAEQEQKIAQKGADTLASIPDDYSMLDGEVNQLSEEIGDLFDYKKSKNRWNADTDKLETGQINVIDGTLQENSGMWTCDYIPVTNKYICSTVTSVAGEVMGYYQRVAQYDSEKNFITCSYGGSEPILLNDNTKYVRVTIAKSNYNVCVYFNDDGALEAYTPFEDTKTIKQQYLPDTPQTTFYGKKMCTYGDSITAHETWQATVMDSLGLSGFQNCGESGATMSGSNSLAIDRRINMIDENCDFIVIMAGVNDAAGRAVGDETLENHNIYGVFGALNLIISKIMYKAKINEGYYADVDYSAVTRFSERKEFPIYLCTQPMHVNQTIINEELFESIENAIRKVGELWGIPVIDVNRLSRLNKANMGNMYYSSDGLHPNANGGKLLGMCIANGLKNNEPYFGY